jgi:hypothetical protein
MLELEDVLKMYFPHLASLGKKQKNLYQERTQKKRRISLKKSPKY